MSKDDESTPNNADLADQPDLTTATLIPSDISPTPTDEDDQESAAAAERLSKARAALAQMKTELATAVDSSPVTSTHATSEPSPNNVDTEIDESPAPLAPSGPAPLNAAEQALALAARARGVPLELPSRIAPDRSDPFAAATRALETARVARGGVPKAQIPETPTPSGHSRDPFKAAEEALERAAAVRAQIGVSPNQEQRKAAARSELARLRRIGPSDPPADDDGDAPIPKKRDL